MNWLIGLLLSLFARKWDKEIFTEIQPEEDDVKNRRSLNAWWWVLFLGMFGFLLGILACASVRPKTINRAAVWILPFPEGDSALAHTTCDMRTQGIPIILLNGRAVEDTERVPPRVWHYVLQHEETHVRQILAYKGTCEDVMARVKADPVFRMKMENEASCVEFNAQVADGFWRDAKRQYEDMVMLLYSRFGPWLTLTQFKELFPCPRPP